MDNFYLAAVVQELALEILGRSVSRVSQTGSTIAIDLRLGDGRRLLASLDPQSPALYLSAEFGARSRTVSPFLSLLRKSLGKARITNIKKPPLDRIVQIDFEEAAVSDQKIEVSLVLALTGRSSNAWLIDADGHITGALFENKNDATADPRPAITPFDPASLIDNLDDSTAREEVLDRYFGPGSIFGPQLRAEFLARCDGTGPAVALRSLTQDLFHRDPAPIVYSRFPFEEIRRRVINIKTDILLSHIELVSARGLNQYRCFSLSEAADRYYNLRSEALKLSAALSAVKQPLAREISRREAAMRAIKSDRARFDNPERLKRFGDLLLANLANARTDGTSATVVDYYDSEQPEIQIEIPEKATLEQAAADYYARYRKARRALDAIALRESEVSRNLDSLKKLLLRLEREPTRDCIDEVSKAAERLLGRTKQSQREKLSRGKQKDSSAVGRRFKSSDGYEIIVGRNDRDNDTITFRVARSNDIWLHAADYPGSHVVVRNPTRQPVPHQTIIEAAELAAFYSQAKREGKAAVHYAQKKFVSKPPRSKPGLARLSSFKTILVSPRCELERLL